MPPAENTGGSLTVEQAGLLWCMRIWVVGQRDGRAVSGRIETVAAQLDAPDAGHFIEAFMAALNRGATRGVEVGCLRCPRVGADEQLLLDTLGLTQERRTFEALLALKPLILPEPARAAVLNAEGVGTALARVGRFLPAPPAATADLGTWFGIFSP